MSVIPPSPEAFSSLGSVQRESVWVCIGPSTAVTGVWSLGATPGLPSLPGSDSSSALSSSSALEALSKDSRTSGSLREAQDWGG